MALNTEQVAILKAHALTVPEMVAAINSGDDVAIRDYFNTLTLIYGWNSFVPPEDYLEVMAWDEVDALQTGKARIWEWITSNQSRDLNFAKQNIRDGLANAFSGVQASVTRNGLLGIASRLMTKAEELLAIVDSSAGTQVDAKTMTFEGNISLADASQIRVYGD